MIKILLLFVNKHFKFMFYLFRFGSTYEDIFYPNVFFNVLINAQKAWLSDSKFCCSDKKFFKNNSDKQINKNKSIEGLLNNIYSINTDKWI